MVSTYLPFILIPPSCPRVPERLAYYGTSDVIPWQCWTRYPQECHKFQAVFVDVDFPDLIRKKRQVVLTTPALVEPLSGLRTEGNAERYPHVMLRSDSYFQVGCDLRRTAALEQALASIVDVKECVFLFVAEVSITYMETGHADALIQWASTIGQSKSPTCWLPIVPSANLLNPGAPPPLSVSPPLSFSFFAYTQEISPTGAGY